MSTLAVCHLSTTFAPQWRRRKALWESVQAPIRSSPVPSLSQLRGDDVESVPWRDAADVGVMGVSTGVPTPADERSASRATLAQLASVLQVGAGAGHSLSEVWCDLHREVFGELPVLPAELAGGPDLGELMCRGPFSGYLERTETGLYVLDLSVFGAYRHQAGVRSLATHATFETDAGRLRCVCITELDSATVHTPESAEWSLARRLVACALLTHTLLVRHIGECHLFVSGPLAVAVRNHLRADHPLALLLWPHVHGALQANNRMVPTLLQEGPGSGPLSEAFNLEARAQWHLLSDEAAVFDLRCLDPVVDRRSRRLEGVPFATPTQDDAVVLFEMLSRYCAGWVHHHYPSEAALTRDSELGSFVNALDIGIPGGVQQVIGTALTRAGLSRLCGIVVYNASVQHERVGNLLWDYAPWADHVPGRLHSDGTGPSRKVYGRFVQALATMCVPGRPLMTDWTWLAPDMRSRSLVYTLQAELARRQAMMEGEGPRQAHRLYPSDLEAVAGM